MRRIKKYSNRKLYDTTDKKYISLSRVSELVSSGEDVYIVDSRTGEDITSTTISQLLAREKGVPPNVLMQILQKGQGTVQGTIAYAKRYATLWQSAFSMAEGELDRIIGKMVRNNELSESDGFKVKTDLISFVGNMKTWMSEKIDQRVSEVLNMMNLTTRDEIENIISENEKLAKRVAELESTLKNNGNGVGTGFHA